MYEIYMKSFNERNQRISKQMERHYVFMRRKTQYW